MDIKLLREVDVYGLERWEPVMKAGFPLSVADVTQVFEALHLALPAFSRSTWSVEDFIRDFAGAGGPTASSIRAQEEGPLLARRVHGRTVGRGSGRQAHANPRHRVGGPGTPSSLW